MYAAMLSYRPRKAPAECARASGPPRGGRRQAARPWRNPLASQMLYRCSRCGYRSDPLWTGTVESVFTCRHCRELVNAELLPFRFETTPCPRCAGRLRRADWNTSSPQADSPCPRCGQPALRGEELFRCDDSFAAPQALPLAGQRVHGFYRGKAAVQLAQSALVAKLDRTPDLPPDTPVECEVIGVDKYVNVRLLRQVSLDGF